MYTQALDIPDPSARLQPVAGEGQPSAQQAHFDAKIAAAKNVIAKARDKADVVEHKSSQTEHMNAFLSKAVAIFGQGTVTPDEMTSEVTQQSANLAIAPGDQNPHA